MQHDLIRHLNKILKGADSIVCTKFKHMEMLEEVYTYQHTRFNRFVKENAENNNCFNVYALFLIVHAYFSLAFFTISCDHCGERKMRNNDGSLQ